MRSDGKQHVSLLKIAPDLLPRIILMRSATKALSLAGERMAIIIASDQGLMAKLLNENLNRIGHAPRSSQYAYAAAMEHWDEIELSNLSDYYGKQTEFVIQALQNMGATMPDPDYKVRGAFYVVADFSDLLGLPLPPETQRALNKIGPIETDEDIAYYLLFTDGIMIAPLSYFGLPERCGYLRITCGSGLAELKILMDRLEQRLIVARQIKQTQLQGELKKIKGQSFPISSPMGARELKTTNVALEKEILVFPSSSRYQLRRENLMARKIQSWWRNNSIVQKNIQKKRSELDRHWDIFIEQQSGEDIQLKIYFASFSVRRRLNYVPFKKYLEPFSLSTIPVTGATSSISEDSSASQGYLSSTSTSRSLSVNSDHDLN
jgi:hypothetical protein